MPQTPAGDDRSRQVGDAQFVWRAFDELPFMVIALEGPQLRVTAATAAFRSRTGLAEPIGTALGELFPDDSWEIAEVCQAAYATGRAQTVQDVRIRIGAPGGAESAEALLDLTVTPRRGADGRMAGVLVQAADAPAPIAARPGEADRARARAAGPDAAHEVIVTLQRELLPAGVPVLPELEISASYLPAGEHTAAGGDWFDAVPLADGRVALAVGDVVGHGAAAAATMAKLRIVLRDRLAATADLLTAVRALDVAAASEPATRAATACVAVFDPVTGALTYCTAGHPPPLLVPRKADAVFLSPTGAGPLGVGSGFTAQHCETVTLDVGAMVVLYTDGILERPGPSPTQASLALAQTVSDVAMNRALYDGRRPAERVCTQTVELLTRSTGHCDDITVLAAQRLRAPGRHRRSDTGRIRCSSSMTVRVSRPGSVSAGRSTAPRPPASSGR